MKSLSNAADLQGISDRMESLSPQDTARWGSMTVHQMICHLDDSYQFALGEKTASSASSFLQRTLIKWVALKTPMQWPKGFPTRPELEQGKGGSRPLDFARDRVSLLSTLERFCKGLPVPLVPHPTFGGMTKDDWMRWGYLHADHHLRQFGR